jgi:hypothetical protein
VVVNAGTLGSLAAGVLDCIDGTFGRLAGEGGSVAATLEKMSLSVVKAWCVWVSGGGSKGRF